MQRINNQARLDNIAFNIPNSLHAVNEGLGDSCNADSIDVSLLELIIQHVYMWHDLMEQD